jgi:hypothetical protein
MRDYQTKSNVGGGADSIVSTKFGAGEFNSIAQELENSVSRSGLTLANSAGTSEDLTQLSQSLFINGVAASSTQDNGAADAIVLTPLTGTSGFKLPPSYASLDGAQFNFFPAFANATTTPTASIGQTTGTQLGAKTIVSESGGALVAGDIDPASLAVIRYDLGSDEFILTRKATGTGVSVGSWDLLLKQEASNDAAIEFTADIDDTYDRYVFVIDGLKPETDGVNLHVRISDDGGTTFETTNYYWAFSGANQSDVAAVYSNSGASLTSQIILNGTQNQTQVGSAAGEGLSGTLNLSNPSDSTQFTRMFFQGVWSRDDQTVDETLGMSSGGWKVTTAVNGVQFLFSSGNITSGTISMYGIKES